MVRWPCAQTSCRDRCPSGPCSSATPVRTSLECKSVFALREVGRRCHVEKQCLPILVSVGCVMTPVGWSLTTLCLGQLEGAFPDTMTKCAELLNRTIDVDFVDINVGCPIDLVYKKVMSSGGCGLSQGSCPPVPIWTWNILGQMAGDSAMYGCPSGESAFLRESPGCPCPIGWRLCTHESLSQVPADCAGRE